MGCCQTSNNRFDSLSISLLTSLILKKNLKLLSRQLETLSVVNKSRLLSTLNTQKTSHESISTNIFGFCLLINDPESFKYFHELGCSLISMESIFNDQGVTSLELICLRNNTQVLCYFWPFYKLSLKDYKRSKSLPATLSSNLKAFPKYNFSPIQLATIFGHIQVITTLYHGISDKSQIFYEIDLNAKEGKSGMNCALLAVKSGRLSVVKYLYYNYNCDFHACDASGCSAIDVAFMEHQIRPAGDYREIVCFLIDVVEVKFELKISYLKAIEQDLELKDYLEKKYRELNTQDCDEGAGEDITIYSKGESSNDIGSSWNSAVQVSKEFEFRNPGRY